MATYFDLNRHYLIVALVHSPQMNAGDYLDGERRDYKVFLAELRLPHQIQLSGENNGFVLGEYAALFMIHRLRSIFSKL